MKKADGDNCLPDKRLAAVCGLFCPACTIFIGTKEHPARLQAIADRLQQPVEELRCDGCRSDRRCFYCRERCEMGRCASGRGIEFCGECTDYPCEVLKVFQAAMPHRIELWESQRSIKEGGFERWFAEMVRHYSCPECGALNSAYDIACRKCGADPSCTYVRLHKDEIMKELAKMK